MHNSQSTIVLYDQTDTIAAVASPPGRGGIGIIRVSGSLCKTIAIHILGDCPSPRYARYSSFRDRDGQVIDQGIALYYPAPDSFTGEDCLELQGHGSPVTLDQLIKHVCVLGARPAQPGEFSQRAFLNNKIDLTQAEAIADLISSQSLQAARCAMRSLQGAFSNELNSLLAELIDLRVYIEATLDFPDEEVDFLADGQVIKRLAALQQRLDEVFKRSRQGRILNEGLNLVIAGLPNAGKSSLLNRLSGQPTAIVTEMPGTTRDVLRCDITIEGLPVHLTDTAGLRESTDTIEQEGVRRAWQAIRQADAILILIDSEKGYSLEDQAIVNQMPDIPVITVWNKADRLSRLDENSTKLYLSTLTGWGMNNLYQAIKNVAEYDEQAEGIFMARQRHLEALGLTKHALSRASELAAEQGGRSELIAEELRLCQQALGEITGKFTSEDLLGRIFSSFCIGK